MGCGGIGNTYQNAGREQYGARPGQAGAGTEAGTEAGGAGGDARGLLDAINKARREHGLGDVSLSDVLTGYAEANDRANNASGELDHHFPSTPAAEITGWASDGMTPEDAVDMWLNSPGHRAILLDPAMTQVGVSLMGAFATADFI
jgi:uncharacterized protein YkwD